ncbi:MAG: CoB--CoM heterodisulfide reductase iron-sulfur subunit B family protein [Anaerolineales bacterium]|nr:CoB--CoM heterodisulfide reductase iron-sulfur subunit B family protein [Anaerolineales bacterium]
MKYTYYPGCSMERSAASYHKSLMAVAPKLGLEFAEVDDWNCCGATEYMSINKMGASALIARNLALAAQEKLNGTLVAPCSACFLNLSKTDHYMAESKELTGQVNEALAAGGLSYQPGSVKTRHLLPIITQDVGFDAIAEQVSKPLYNLRVAPYYGCLIVRPDYPGDFDSTEYPMDMDDLMTTLGAEVVDFPLKTQCCGGHMTQISEPTALELIRRLLKNASDYEADVIVTLCPMCQLNLDAFQDGVNRHFGTDYHIPILYFTQLMGLAFGVDQGELGFGSEFIDARPALEKITTEPPAKPKRARRAKEALPMPGEG